MGFIFGVLGWFNICNSINVIHHDNNRFSVMLPLGISSFIALWSENTPLNDFLSFICVKVYFMAQNMFSLRKCLTFSHEKNMNLMFCNAVFFKFNLGHNDWLSCLNIITFFLTTCSILYRDKSVGISIFICGFFWFSYQFY